MRHLHRFAAALMGALLLQLSLLTAGVVCSPASARAAEVARGVANAGGAADGGEHAHHGHGADDAPDGQRGGHQSEQMHCAATMACTTLGTATGSIALASALLPAADDVLAVNSAAPASITGAPEPPPPRA